MFKKQKEYSKILLDRIYIGTVIVSLFTMYMVWLIRDTSILSYLIPAVFAELSVATGFYYYKAKAENEIKLAKAYKDLGLEYYKKEEEIEGGEGRI